MRDVLGAAFAPQETPPEGQRQSCTGSPESEKFPDSGEIHKTYIRRPKKGHYGRNASIGHKETIPTTLDAT